MADNDILYPADLQEIANESDEETSEVDDAEIEIDEDSDLEEGYFNESVFFDGIDFSRDAHNRVRGATGIEAYEQWCRTCLATERGSLMCYPDDFGLDMDRVRNASSFGEAKAILASEVERALLADSAKRTKSIEKIEILQIGDDSVDVSVEVTGADGATRDIVTTIDGRLWR